MGIYLPLRRLTDGGPTEAILAAEDYGVLVVLKRLSPQFRDPEIVSRFRHQAELAVSLDHPNIARIYEVAPDGDACTIVMEYVPGEDLRFLLKGVRTSSPVPLDVTCAIIDGVAAGLAAAHGPSTGEGLSDAVVHGDISPANLMVTYEGRVKIVDFGLASALSRARSSDPARLRKKLSYSSPEQLSGHPIDHRADLFALGAVAWEMLTSRQLFSGPNEGAIVQNVLERHIPPPSLYNPQVGAELDRIVLALLCRDLETRTSSATALRQALASAFSLHESAQTIVTRWMRSTFAAAQRRRATLEDAAIREAAHGVDYNGRELPVAFAEPVGGSIRPSDDSRRRTSSSEISLTADSPEIHPERSYLRWIAGVGVVLFVGLVMFILVFTLRSRLRPATRTGSGAGSAFSEPVAGRGSSRSAPAIDMRRDTRADHVDDPAIQPVGPAPKQQPSSSSAIPDRGVRAEPEREGQGATAEDGPRDSRNESSRSRRARKPDVSADEPLTPTVARTESPVDGGPMLDVRPAGEVQSRTGEQEGNPYVYK